MTLNRPVDQYTLELEIPNGEEFSPLPVRVIAKNTYDQETAELRLSIEQTRERLISIMEAFRDGVESYMEQLQQHRHVRLVSQIGANRDDSAIFNPPDLIKLGFNPDDVLR